MKKFKLNPFYVWSFILYFLLVITIFVFSAIYLEPNIRSFYSGYVMTNKTGSDNIIEVYIKNDGSWKQSNYNELLDYFDKYVNEKVVGFDFKGWHDYDAKNIELKNFVCILNSLNNLVVGFVPQPGTPQSREETLLNDRFKAQYSVKANDDYLMPFPIFGNVEIIDKPYLDSIHHFGSVWINHDKISGNVLNYPYLFQVGDSFYPSFALQLYLLQNGTNEIYVSNGYIEVPKTSLKIPYNIYKSFNGDFGIYYSDLRYFENKGATSIRRIFNHNYRKRVSHNFYYANDMLRTYRKLELGQTLNKNDISPNVFKNKIVIIGQINDGATDDVLKTPINDRHPGTDIQATAYDNLTQNRFIKDVPFIIQLIFFILLQILTMFFVLKKSFIKSLSFTIVIDVLFIGVSLLLAIPGFYMSVINPLSVQLVSLIFGYSFKFLLENRLKEKIKTAMGKYISEDIMKNVVKNIDNLDSLNKRAVVTILFSDIRGFTSLSEKLEPDEVSKILNEYFSEMEPIIRKYNGVINKFIGDAVMAIFGEPIQDVNHPQNAVKCAYEMLKRVEYLREKWLREGKPKIEIGVGINTGEVFIGNVGTKTRMEYTVIGDTVNLASRIESYNKVYKTNLLISSSTYEYVSSIADVIKINEVQIRGKSKKTNIYEVLRIVK